MLWDVLGDDRRFLGTLRDALGCSEILQDPTERSGMRRDAPRCSWGCSGKLQDAWGQSEMLQDALGCSGMLQDARGCSKMLRDAQGYVGKHGDAQGCSRMLQDTWGCFKMLKDA